MMLKISNNRSIAEASFLLWGYIRRIFVVGINTDVDLFVEIFVIIVYLLRPCIIERGTSRPTHCTVKKEQEDRSLAIDKKGTEESE